MVSGNPDFTGLHDGHWKTGIVMKKKIYFLDLVSFVLKYSLTVPALKIDIITLFNAGAVQ